MRSREKHAAPQSMNASSQLAAAYDQSRGPATGYKRALRVSDTLGRCHMEGNRGAGPAFLACQGVCRATSPTSHVAGRASEATKQDAWLQPEVS